LPIKVTYIKEKFNRVYHEVNTLCQILQQRVQEAQLALQAILYANQLRSEFNEVEKVLQEAECKYQQQQYKETSEIVINILTNSIKYTPDNGLIRIYAGPIENRVYIKVIDNGIGIPQKDLGRLFERFYRVDKARTREMGGTGLGLSIAKEILNQNNGDIDIKSEVGKGTEVVVKIPTNVKVQKINKKKVADEEQETSEEEVK